ALPRPGVLVAVDVDEVVGAQLLPVRAAAVEERLLQRRLLRLLVGRDGPGEDQRAKNDPECPESTCHRQGPPRPMAHSPSTVTTTVRCRGRTSHSRRKICCQVPSASSPPPTGTVSPWPSSVAWRWLWPLPSCQARSWPYSRLGGMSRSSVSGRSCCRP